MGGGQKRPKRSNDPSTTIRTCWKWKKQAPPLTDTFKISPKVASKVDYEVTVEGDTTTTKTVYSYNDLKFHVEAKVDAVQQHNAPEAIQSAWGKHVSVQGDTLSLN